MTIPTAPEGASRNARPFLHGPELEAVCAAVQAGQYGHGQVTEQFEHDTAAFLGVPDLVATATGTAALHVALLGAGIGPGDEVIVPSLTFCATIQAIVACGASPRFVDVSPGTLCIEPQHVADAITPATRAVLPVLYGGRAVDLSPLGDVLDRRRITVIEDAAHAFGSFHGPHRVGATGALTCFSFGPIKNLTCGQGGAIVPRTPQEAHTLRRLRNVGIVQPQAERAAATSYVVQDFGMRVQMSPINAAIGIVQLQHFAAVQAMRKTLWQAYAEALKDVGAVALVDVDVEHTVPHNCVVRIPARDHVFQILRGQGIGVGVHYPPNHPQPAFAPWRRDLPVTETIGREILTLPFHPATTGEDVRHVVSALHSALRSFPLGDA